MKGGLIQLVLKGREDQVLTSEPDFTFFKTVYRKHTNFSIDNNIKRIGKFNFGQLIDYKIPREGDLLGPINLKIKLPKYNKKSLIKINYPKDIQLKLFDNINFYVKDEKIETLNYDIYQLIYQFHMSTSKKIQFNKLIKLIDKGNYYEFYLPLLFFFYNSPNLYIPLVSLNLTEIHLKMRINNFENSNNFIDISIDKNTILLGEDEREKFGSNCHEYLIENFSYYNPFLLNKKEIVNIINFSGIIKNIYFSVNMISDKDQKTFLLKEKEYDIYLSEYLELKKNYDLYLQNNSNYDQEFKILEENQEYIKNNNLSIIDKILNNKYLNKLDLEFLLFLLIKYTNYPKNEDNYYIKKLLVYLTRIYKNQDIIKKKSIIDKFKIKINNHNLFSKKDEIFYNNVISHNITNSSADDGFYFLTFSLYPEENQPSGYLNFNKIDETVLIIDVNDDILNNPAEIKIFTKEYNLLKIMGGQGGLFWQ